MEDVASVQRMASLKLTNAESETHTDNKRLT